MDRVVIISDDRTDNVPKWRAIDHVGAKKYLILFDQCHHMGDIFIVVLNILLLQKKIPWPSAIRDLLHSYWMLRLSHAMNQIIIFCYDAIEYSRLS